jgi:AraC-like DNA-binding protein
MADSESETFQAAFFQCCPMAESVIRLFDNLPQTYFYAKDLQGRFVKVNQMFLDNHGLTDESEAIGRTDRDFHPPAMAEAYVAEDQRVMKSGEPLPGQVWLVLHRRRVPRWYVSTKTPLFDPKGGVVGLAGAMYRINEPGELSRHFHELLPVVTHIEKNYADNISMREMATRVKLSATHFNRRFQQLMRMTPTQYLRTVRVQAARRLLTESSRSLADIAVEVGFTDQSHFTKRFREVTGITPKEYRRTFVRG